MKTSMSAREHAEQTRVRAEQLELIHAVEYAAARCLHISALGKKRGMKWIIEEAQAARKQLDRAIELLNTAPRALDGKDGGKS